MNAWNRNGSLLYPVVGDVDMQSLMRQVYTWMVLGMLTTSFVAFATVNSSVLINLALNPIILLIAAIAEIGLVIGISRGINRLSSGVATMLFLLYAALNGFTLSIIFLAFSIGSVFLAFATTAALFAVMSVIGYTTQVDLSKMGTYLMMAVIGLVIAMVVNIFVGSGVLDTIISMAGVLIFTALTAYDTQRIGRMAAQMSMNGEGEIKFGIIGALKLYLDFINMFLFILRLVGRRR
ncbi:MAG: Bax inhibitor-1/YccA family protein [Anaerolineales bacterium]